MNFKELLEGAEPKMPGAPSGISIMTPQQFVAKAGDSKPEEEVDEGYNDLGREYGGAYVKGRSDDARMTEKLTRQAKAAAAKAGKTFNTSAEYRLWYMKQKEKQGVAEGSQEINWVKPNFDFEWHEVEEQSRMKQVPVDVRQYYQKHFPNKDAWLKAVQNGKAVVVPPDHAYEIRNAPFDKASLQKVLAPTGHEGPIGPAKEKRVNDLFDKGQVEMPIILKTSQGLWLIGGKTRLGTANYVKGLPAKVWLISGEQGVAEGAEEDMSKEAKAMTTGKCPHCHGPVKKTEHPTLTQYHCAKCGIRASVDKQDVAESQEHLDRIRKLSGLDEATKLPASSREFGGDEFQDYMKRIVGTPDIDKKTGKVKVDKKGMEKYVSGKTKTDKYKMPYIHRSSVVTYLSPDGKTYDEDAVKQTLAQRPKALLKQNEKMKHSNGELEQFFNVGFAALTGIALDEDTNKLIIVNTCPGAGSCKVDCFAMKGGKIQFKAAWQSDGRILTYLLNDPDGFFNQLSSEISKEEQLGKKGGYTVTIRWHDAGDFFSPEYLDMALKMAAKHPDVKFYAYTKMAGAALAKKPDNFIINWSEGAHTSQEKQVKASDANLETTKNSRIVPDELFQDLLIKDQKGNLVKGDAGQWQVQPDKLSELKQRLAKQYGLSANSILSYDEYMAKRKSIPAGMKYNVIVAPGEGDISANDPNIISTLLLRH